MIHYPPSESQGLQQSENQGFRSPQDAASDQSFNLFTCNHSPSDFIHIYRQLNVCLLFFCLFVVVVFCLLLFVCCCFLFCFGGFFLLLLLCLFLLLFFVCFCVCFFFFFCLFDLFSDL